MSGTFDDTLSHFDTVLKHDRQTDGQNAHSLQRTSRDKNKSNIDKVWWRCLRHYDFKFRTTY